MKIFRRLEDNGSGKNKQNTFFYLGRSQKCFCQDLATCRTNGVLKKKIGDKAVLRFSVTPCKSFLRRLTTTSE